MTGELIKNQNKLMQFQCIQVHSNTNKDVDACIGDKVFTEKRISLAKAFSTTELIDEVENKCGKRTGNSNGNSSYNQKFNSHNKNFNNNPVTHESRDNNFKNNNLNNDGNKVKYKIKMKAKANTASKSDIFQKDEEEKDEVEEEIDLSKRKILKPKIRKNLKTTTFNESIKINKSFPDLNNNNHVINDNKLKKDEEIKNYIDKNKIKINKEIIIVTNHHVKTS
ncbi:hypothetical protein LY90DRAFT_507053 [Neocallimastix californiae]|uniref:Uncharacterized protein n=1 Tax=Neocallimastix californiae TaxID=1754190 RepID=A0A1Y2D8N0_9FUNG|nr:hypothetical protein LY90DRAFT_507053 [Neocallimastix californiae]|eukprot:ORY55577.1 hypothetical protein LY90DRAFT_507053 [Neocallimastix californiae]